MWRWLQSPQIPLFVVSLAVLLITVVPTVYEFDSAELAIGAATLGLVHAPGYPLYLLIGHLFTWLPIGDAAFRVNLFSVFSLALSAPLLYTVLRRLRVERWAAISAALTFVCLYDIWLSGIAAEVYAPQVVTLGLLAYTLTWLLEDNVSARRASGIGFAFGIAVAMAPSSILFAPAVALAFVLKRVSWQRCLLGALAACLVFGCSLAYFPIRYAADPALNLLGAYDASGVFQPVNLQTVDGIVWVLRGAQFEGLFFAQGTPFALSELVDGLGVIFGNYLGVGFAIGLVGVIALWRQRRGLFLIWLTAWMPYTYFYSQYGAVDRDTMFGPSLLTWTLALAFGWMWVRTFVKPVVMTALLIGLPALTFGANLVAIQGRAHTEVRSYAETVIRAIPENALVFGDWKTIVPLQYLQIVEGQRQDLQLRNLFLFEEAPLKAYLASETAEQRRPVVFLEPAVLKYLNQRFSQARPLRVMLPA
ncbi:MAG: DUF2723 domain-containing protein, partial [Anaerolineae bacterium]